MKSDFLLLIKFITMCLMLFLFFNFISVLLGSVILYFKKGFFPFSWSDVFDSFFRSGYVGGLILGIGIWIKVKLRERKDKKSASE